MNSSARPEERPRLASGGLNDPAAGGGGERLFALIREEIAPGLFWIETAPHRRAMWDRAAEKFRAESQPARELAAPAAIPPAAEVEDIDGPYRFYSGPWENSELPTIVKDDPEGGDPHILCVISRVHFPDRLRTLCDAANRDVAAPNPNRRRKP